MVGKKSSINPYAMVVLTPVRASLCVRGSQQQQQLVGVGSCVLDKTTLCFKTGPGKEQQFRPNGQILSNTFDKYYDGLNGQMWKQWSLAAHSWPCGLENNDNQGDSASGKNHLLLELFTDKSCWCKAICPRLVCLLGLSCSGNIDWRTSG